VEFATSHMFFRPKCKKAQQNAEPMQNLVGGTGFEPVTPAV